MAFNNFLSTSRSREISINFARQSNLGHIAVLFVMKIDPKVCEQSWIPFVDVKDEGYYKDQEKEVLFATQYLPHRANGSDEGWHTTAHVGSSSHTDG